MSKLTEEDVRDIFTWAIGASGMAHVLYFAPPASEPDEVFEKLETFTHGIERMISEMPEPLRKAGMDLAVETADEVKREDEIVDEFMAEVDKYL